MSSKREINNESTSRLISVIVQGITVVHFTDAKILDQRNINLIGAEIMELVETSGAKKMLLNLENVNYLSSAVLGKLISLQKALRQRGGMLKLCSIAPSIFEVFEITRLDRVFDIYPTEPDAIEAFRWESPPRP